MKTLKWKRRQCTQCFKRRMCAEVISHDHMLKLTLCKECLERYKEEVPSEDDLDREDMGDTEQFEE